VPALEPVSAWRVVATSAALDAARWQGATVDVLRIAPDEALGIGATGVEVDDPDAIVQPEAGVSTARLTASELLEVSGHIEWAVPDAARGRTIAQGKIAGTPAKLVLGEPTLLVVQTCYVHDLRTRLGW
jgi:hypothetical protein